MSKVPPAFAGKENSGSSPAYHLASSQLHGSSLLWARAWDNSLFRQHADYGTEQRAVSSTSWFGENNSQEPELLKNYQESNLAAAQKTSSLNLQSWCLCFRGFKTFPECIRETIWKVNWLWKTVIYLRGTVHISVIELRDAESILVHPIHLVTEGRKVLQSQVIFFPFSPSFNISE